MFTDKVILMIALTDGMAGKKQSEQSYEIARDVYDCYNVCVRMCTLDPHP